MVTAAHGHSQFQRSHQFVAGLSCRERIEYLTNGGRADGVGRGESDTGTLTRWTKNKTEAVVLRSYSVRVWYFTDREAIERSGDNDSILSSGGARSRLSFEARGAQELELFISRQDICETERRMKVRMTLN
ncbi:hypothetical protein EVAR_27048_1 [Eumeta japonica]|uniref:Uncharacterized protein n=1 Tax=Eumeta variegata TaxID=151549 RepID=A0A4C1WD72_EUMVA|nr:hypothetical protein EVAR_27048_1 [Eumeta japonica]